MAIGRLRTEADVRQFVRREVGNRPELVRQLQAAVAALREAVGALERRVEALEDR